MSSLERLEHDLLVDESLRRRFAETPAAVLRERRVDLPEDCAIPSSVPLEILELKLLELSVRLQQAGITLSAAPDGDASGLRRMGEVAGTLAAEAGAADVTAWLLQANESIERAGRDSAAPGLTVLGPTGTRVTDLSVEDVASLIRRLRQSPTS